MENLISNKKISIIIPVYNEENTVGESLKSIIEQSHTNLKLLLNILKLILSLFINTNMESKLKGDLK